MDPRPGIVSERLKNVRRKLLVCSGKGGVGKSLVSSLTALLAARSGLAVGLLDLDFHGPSCHLILGAEGVQPTEDRGLIPPTVADVKLMSIAFFAGSSPVPLRGIDVTNAMLELLAVTRWGRLDLLVIDSPPGTGEEVLDTARLIKGVEALVVTTPSRLSLATVSRLVALLREIRVPILGLLENMVVEGRSAARVEAEEWGIEYLGSIPYDPQVELALGNPALLLRTRAAAALEKAVEKAGLLNPA